MDNNNQLNREAFVQQYCLNHVEFVGNKAEMAEVIKEGHDFFDQIKESCAKYETSLNG